MVYPKWHPIVFYDGECGICNHTVQFLIRRDRNKCLRYAPLQGETARAVLGAAAAQKLDTLYFFDGSASFDRSTAALHIASFLPWPWAMASWARIVPRFIRDFAYDALAKRRISLGGQHQTCGLLSAEQRGLFLP